MAQVVLASPRNGCGSFQNEAALANAIVIVERGGCRFSDKAINVQTADGAAIVVVNDDGPAIRMPFAEDETVSVHVPSLMVSQVRLVGVCGRRVFRHGSRGRDAGGNSRVDRASLSCVSWCHLDGMGCVGLLVWSPA